MILKISIISIDLFEFNRSDVSDMEAAVDKQIV